MAKSRCSRWLVALTIALSIPQPASAQGWSEIFENWPNIFSMFNLTGPKAERMLVITIPPGAQIMDGARKLGETALAAEAWVRLSPRHLQSVRVLFASGAWMFLSDCRTERRGGRLVLHCREPR